MTLQSRHSKLHSAKVVCVPLYEYQCKKCKHRFEKIQKFSDPLVKKCPKCGGPVEQLLSAPSVQFKGSGWYVTDYARKGSSGSSSESSASSDGGGSAAKAASDKADKADSKKSEKKPAKK
jgi:putative FmdB family regulatory protein